jgi:hypothetical protein
LTIKDIDRMTIDEYYIRLESQQLAELDNEYLEYVNALAVRAYKATNKAGDKYLYNNVIDLFDRKDIERKMTNKGEEKKNDKAMLMSMALNKMKEKGD